MDDLDVSAVLVMKFISYGFSYVAVSNLMVSLFLTPLVADVKMESSPLQPIHSTASDVKDWKVYSDPKLGFSFKYPLYLTTQIFPDGVILINDREYPRQVVQVTNQAFINSPRKQCQSPIECFKFYRDARPGVIADHVEAGTGVYQKVENLTVDGYPAVKILYDSGPLTGPVHDTSPPLKADQGAPSPPLHTITVHINKEGTIWSVISIASDQQQQKGRLPVLEQILASLKLR